MIRDLCNGYTTVRRVHMWRFNRILWTSFWTLYLVSCEWLSIHVRNEWCICNEMHLQNLFYYFVRHDVAIFNIRMTNGFFLSIPTTTMEPIEILTHFKNRWSKFGFNFLNFIFVPICGRQISWHAIFNRVLWKSAKGDWFLKNLTDLNERAKPFGRLRFFPKIKAR